MTFNNKRNIILIPARLNSSRLPNKLLLNIDNKSIIQHTYENSKNSKYASKSIILVDSKKLFNHCKKFTDDVMITSNKHNSGTERIIEFLHKNQKFENIVNVQGDEPFLSSDLIDKLFLELNNGEGIVTFGLFSDNTDLQNSTSKVKIVLDKNSHAIYFSRLEIPYDRDKNNQTRKLIHIGLYGYKSSELILFGSYKENILENIEKLEQLRFIENNRKIKVLLTNNKTIGIDTIDDYKQAVKYYEERYFKKGLEAKHSS